MNDSELVINTDLIEFVEAIPETMISMTSGKKVMVKENIDEIVARVVEYRRLINQTLTNR